MSTKLHNPLDIKEQAAPGTPGSGFGRLYVNTSNQLVYIDDGGVTQIITNDLSNDGTYPVNTVATSGTTQTLPLQPAHRITLSANCTFTFPTVPAGKGHTFVLWLSGAFTPTFPASVKWSGGAPTYATPSVYTFSTVDAGTTWVGALIGSALA